MHIQSFLGGQEERTFKPPLQTVCPPWNLRSLYMKICVTWKSDGMIRNLWALREEPHTSLYRALVSGTQPLPPGTEYPRLTEHTCAHLPCPPQMAEPCICPPSKKKTDVVLLNTASSHTTASLLSFHHLSRSRKELETASRTLQLFVSALKCRDLVLG